jgi:hypothetical protein
MDASTIIVGHAVMPDGEVYECWQLGWSSMELR